MSVDADSNPDISCDVANCNEAIVLCYKFKILYPGTVHQRLVLHLEVCNGRILYWTSYSCISLSRITL